MASTTQLMPNTKMINNNVKISDMFRSRSHSSRKVCLPEKPETTSSSSSSTLVATGQSKSLGATLIEAPVATTAKFIKNSCAPKLAHLWREIQGSKDWEDLVEPLNPLLRREIIRYGEFVSACYKAFDLDPNSKRYLNCKYGKKSMLKEVGMENSGYEVTKYIYATPDINIPVQPDACCGRWIGYVAVSDDITTKKLGRRDILVTFRGTVTNPEWIANFMSSLTPARLDPHNPRPEVKVESGFLSLYTSDESSDKFGLGSCREQLLSEVSRLLNKHKGEEISITIAGHSMGSSLGVLLGYDIAELGLNSPSKSGEIPVTVFSFGGPRVGNSGFKQRCEELGVKVLRIVNVNDPITKMPGVLFNENFRVLGGRYEFPWSCSCYAHVGVELVLDFFNMGNPSCVHDLETYISLLRSPKRSAVDHEIDHHHRRDSININIDINIGVDLVNRAKEMISNAQNFNMSPWINAAGNMMNLVQSQRTT